MKRKTIAIKKYNKIMDKIIKGEGQVHEKLILMLEEAAKYNIKEKRKKK